MTGVRLAYPRRRRGLDHDWFAFRRLDDAGPVVWPQGRVAVCLQVPIEFFPLDSHAPVVRPLGGLDRGYPDFWSYSNRDYGLRIGVYRIMRVLDRHGVTATAQVQGNAVRHYPRVMAEIARRDWEFVAAGVDMGAPHHGGLDIETERGMIASTRAMLRDIGVTEVHGWASPGQMQSADTLALIAESGFSYVCDWANDDLPYWVTTPHGRILSMPAPIELSDRFCMVQHTLSIGEYADQVVEAYRVLEAEARRTGAGRMLCVSLAPWVIGYPHRIAGLDTILHEVSAIGGAWFTTTGAAARAYATQFPQAESV